MRKTKAFKQFAAELEADLVRDYGHLLSGEKLYTLLGFKTLSSYKQAVWRDQIPVPIFSIEKRQGKFALTKDVAVWLAEIRFDAVAKNAAKKKEVPK